MTIVRMHYDRLECDSGEKKENGIEIEDVFRWIRISNLTFRILRGTRVLARVSAAGYIGHSIRGKIGPITHLSDMRLLKKYLLVPIRRSPFVHQYPDYILKAIFTTPTRANSLLPTHHTRVGKKRERTELMAILNFPHEVSTLLSRPSPQIYTYTRAHTYIHIYRIVSIFMCRFDSGHSLEALVYSVRQRGGIG